ncbi:hypothetical protein ACH5RR_031760 [Cinchona calisaya]|uniref:Transposase, Ptta/En/Spm, plant n=1 Tax=Cinchona calisaya TaxID=153742 RepID=A0ABD2YH79_9GENT
MLSCVASLMAFEDKDKRGKKKKKKKPDFKAEEVWLQIVAGWDDSKSRKRAAINKENRISDAAKMAPYAGGSVNIQEHKRRMTDREGNPPNFDMLFVKCYKKKDKSWSGPRVESVYNEYQNLRVAQMEQTDSPLINESSQPSINDTDMWVKAAGGIKFGRVFGMGSLAKEYTSSIRANTGCSSAPPPQPPPPPPPPPPPVGQIELEQLKEQIHNMQDILQKKDDQMEDMRKRMDEMIAVFMQVHGKSLDTNQGGSSSGPSIIHGPTRPSTT